MTTTQHKTACTRDCPDACGLIATVENGTVVRLDGDPDHPVTQGFICGRTRRFPERQNSSERLTKPLLRRQKSGSFDAIEWPAALDLAAENLIRFKQESGGTSIMQYRCGGSLGIMKHVGDYFFERFGPVTEKSGDVCTGAAEAAQLEDFGTFESNDYFDLHNAKTIFLWGKNVSVSNIHLIPELKKARANGTRIVLIDPIHHQTTAVSDCYIQPRPGGDAAIALGIAACLLKEGGWDPDASGYCDHHDRFQQLVRSHTPEEWARAADISLDQLRMLAAEWSNGPTCSLIGWGLQRRKFGATSIRAIDALVAVTGNLGIAGGGASSYFGRRTAFDFSFSNPAVCPRRIPEPLFGPGVMQAADPPIRMMWVWAANPVAMLPESETVAEALRSREFTVVVDPFMTDSTQCADLILPTTTMLEEDDLVGAYGHHYVGAVNKVVEPPKGVLTDHEIFRELSRRTGHAEEFDVETEVWRKRLLSRIDAEGAAEQLMTEGFVRNPFTPEILFADRVFPTETGRVNLIQELPEELTTPETDRGLRLTALSTSKSQASQWPTESQEGPAEAVIHPDAAGDHADGDVVSISSTEGTMQVRLKHDARQRPDVLLMEKGGWHSKGRSANALVPAEVTDNGECAVYYDTVVRLEG